MKESFVTDQYLDTVVDEIYPLLKREFERVSAQSAVRIAEEIIRKRMLPLRVAPGDIVYAYSEKWKKVLGYRVEQVISDYEKSCNGSDKIRTRAYAYAYYAPLDEKMDSIDFNVCELCDRVHFSLDAAYEHSKQF